MSNRPNIVFILTDQQRYDTIAALGFDHMITPNLDRLAQRGAAFEKMYITSPSCAPSRASLFTGVYPHTNGFFRNDETWNYCWVKDLAEAGYHTVNVGKMHTMPVEGPFGFHEWINGRGFVTAQQAAIWMEVGCRVGSRRINLLIDATNLVVAPGFIDLHTHSDFTLAANGRAESQVHQGVTTEVVGQCGVSCAPAKNHADIALMAPGFTEGAVDLDWLSFSDYLAHLDRMALGVNVAAFVGHGTLQGAVLSDALRPADEDEMDQIADLLEDSIEGGAFGYSTGLEYWPGSLATPDQLADLAAIAAKHDILYATHVRNRDLFYDLGFGEALATARAAGARLQISHIQPKFGAPDYAMSHAVEMCEQARRRGVDVAFDVIPHDWSHTRVNAIFPQWAQEGGVEAIAARLKDPAIREKIKRNPRPMWRLVSTGQWDKIVLMHSEQNGDLVGMTFEEIGKKRGVDPFDAAMDLLLEEGANMNHLMWTSQSFSDVDIKLALSQPECAVISDTLALAPYGCLKHHIGSLSGYGWAARFLQHSVRDQNVLSLEEGVRRLTSLPASRIGIKERGRIETGAHADITVFDSEAVESHCDVEDPPRYATGIAHVLVNGGIAFQNGRRTDVDSGTVLRR